MNTNVRTGIALLCAAAVGGLLLVVAQVSDGDGAALTGIGGVMLMVFGVLGLASIAFGVLQRD